ncbi:rhodanese-like domain-containing protein [Buchnera aphidicola]|uniref:Rhodanese-like domain-containing protein n=1 Tax=Buchnera aphidicola (Artemisaphis artemisicola) TaxID=1241836 RepID=A0A4D6XIR4_9GAMM|nr:rhodanese-like domain-containing protein [Buchnera aphidicola]QCI15749.1 rhodanese-like domain-containing protein [Buchnera aphidicola (Artemisaphis artemisicola)]
MQNIMFFINANTMLVSIWFFFLILVVFFTLKSFFLKAEIINTIKAIKLINQDNAIIIDTRSLDLFQKGHIINSINIPLDSIFLGSIKELEEYKLLPIILIIDQTQKYNKCAQEFLKHGFNRIYILKNGIYYWNIENLPLSVTDKKS